MLWLRYSSARLARSFGASPLLSPPFSSPPWFIVSEVICLDGFSRVPTQPARDRLNSAPKSKRGSPGCPLGTGTDQVQPLWGEMPCVYWLWSPRNDLGGLYRLYDNSHVRGQGAGLVYIAGYRLGVLSASQSCGRRPLFTVRRISNLVWPSYDWDKFVSACM